MQAIELDLKTLTDRYFCFFSPIYGLIQTQRTDIL